MVYAAFWRHSTTNKSNLKPLDTAFGPIEFPFPASAAVSGAAPLPFALTILRSVCLGIGPFVKLLSTAESARSC